jgi:hypothetical protein
MIIPDMAQHLCHETHNGDRGSLNRGFAAHYDDMRKNLSALPKKSEDALLIRWHLGQLTYNHSLLKVSNHEFHNHQFR